MSETMPIDFMSWRATRYGRFLQIFISTVALESDTYHAYRGVASIYFLRQTAPTINCKIMREMLWSTPRLINIRRLQQDTQLRAHPAIRDYGKLITEHTLRLMSPLSDTV